MARIMLAVCLLAFAQGLPAQQTGGEKELGIGGILSVSHAAKLDGNATALFSVGKYVRRQHFLGVNLLPMVTFGGESNSVGGFFGGNYRYLFAVENRRTFPFVGVGGGAFVIGGTGSNAVTGSGLAEVGVKTYFSARTSLDVAYNFLYLGTPGGLGSGGFSFQQNTRSQVILSIRHLF
jgi:hypothetical protein